MRNVQIIDGADNCSYLIFQFTDEEFSEIFSAPGQNIEFIEDVVERLGDVRVGQLLTPVWKRMVPKDSVQGIHGTLFYQLTSKKKYYPTKKEEEMVNPFKT